MGVADDEPHASEAAAPQRAQEGRPEGAVLAVTDGQAQDLTVAVRRDPGGDDDGLRHDRGPLVGLHVGGIEEDVGEARVAEAAVAEGPDDAIELLADAADTSLLLMPASMPRATTRSSTLRVETPWT